MVERLEVKVLCGACQRQPRVDGNCTRWNLAVRTSEVFPARACGMEAGDIPQHRTFSESSSRLSGLGQCARQHDALYLVVAGE